MLRTVRETARRNPGRTRLIAVLAVLLGIAGLVWFQPHKLFLDQRVAEDRPSAAEPVLGAAGEVTGRFRPLAHDGEGTARLLRDGEAHILRFDPDFSVENGPDLFVYLSPAGADASGRAFADGAYVVGPLKGNIGAQNYRLPAGVDPSRYRSVVIWCRRFATPFAAAPLG